MEYDEVKEYWDSRAGKDKSPQSTTNDYYLRELEIRNLKAAISKYKKSKKTVADFGCGDGFSTVELAKTFPDMLFFGYDYSKNMIDIANKIKNEQKIKNVSFEVIDVVKDQVPSKFDIVFTDRCIINLLTWDLQKLSIKRIFDSLNPEGVFIMIENFADGQDEFNKLRKEVGLDEIPIREHNFYLDKKILIPYLKEFGKVLEIQNISSLYYVVSRIIYSQICKMNNITPDYFDIHHKLGSLLPSAGNFGPVSMIVVERGK